MRKIKLNIKYIHQFGQTLVEVVVVVGLVVLLVLGIVAGTTRSLAQTQTVQNQTQALRLAQEGIEFARQLRDMGWATFAAYGTPQSTYCVGLDGMFEPAGVGCTTANIGHTTMIRTVTLNLISSPDGSGNTTMQVTVTVSWPAPVGTNNSVTLTTYLTQWQ